MKNIIFEDDFYKMILEANTSKKAKTLAKKIAVECEQWRALRYELGIQKGKYDLQFELRKLLGAKENNE